MLCHTDSKWSWIWHCPSLGPRWLWLLHAVTQLMPCRRTLLNFIPPSSFPSFYLFLFISYKFPLFNLIVSFYFPDQCQECLDLASQKLLNSILSTDLNERRNFLQKNLNAILNFHCVEAIQETHLARVHTDCAQASHWISNTVFKILTLHLNIKKGDNKIIDHMTVEKETSDATAKVTIFEPPVSTMETDDSNTSSDV